MGGGASKFKKEGDNYEHDKKNLTANRAKRGGAESSLVVENDDKVDDDLDFESALVEGDAEFFLVVENIYNSTIALNSSTILNPLIAHFISRESGESSELNDEALRPLVTALNPENNLALLVHFPQPLDEQTRYLEMRCSGSST